VLIVIDDVLDGGNLAIIQKFFSASLQARQMQWADGNLDWFLKSGGPFSKILNRVSGVFDISSMVGIEHWAHYGTKPNWHIDKDETLLNRTGQLATPICSIVFYAEIDCLTNGKFMTEDVTVTPKPNRLLAFSPGVRHGVEDYTGTRMSVAINPWALKPEGY
jgi:hypothetical protein